MAYTGDCEACAVSVHLTDAEIAAIFGNTVRVKQVKTVSEEEYSRRVAICKECDQLLYGTTCRHCGCLIQIKAKLSGARCPNPYAPKWGS